MELANLSSYEMPCKVNYMLKRSASDPQETPVVIIGLVENLSKLHFADVASHLEPRVTKEVIINKTLPAVCNVTLKISCENK